jgi:hypothetical protein
MGELRFEWDPAKPAANQRKYGITPRVAQHYFIAITCFTN